MKKLTEATCGWLAGFVDGEGSFGVVNNAGSWRLRGSITNTHRGSLDHVRSLIGGGIIIGRPLSQENENWSDSWKIQIQGNALRRLLDAIRPHVLIKKDQVELCFEYLALTPNGIARAERVRIREALMALSRNGFRTKKVIKNVPTIVTG